MKTLHKAILWKYHCPQEKFLSIPYHSLLHSKIMIISGFIGKQERQERGKAGRKEWRETGKNIYFPKG